jgi:putative membrane protein
MEKAKHERNHVLKIATIAYLVWFSIGYILIIFDWLPPFLEWANAAYLFIAGTLAAIWLSARVGVRAAMFLFSGTSIISFFAEWFGVKTGWWFGEYEYGSAFAPYLFGVPLAIPFAWVTVLTMSAAFTPFWRKSRVGFAAIAAFLAVSFDFMLDPVSVAQKYWIWNNPGAFSLYDVPWTNFLSWWVTAFIIYLSLGHWWLKSVDRIDKLLFWTSPPWLLTVTLLLLFATLAIQLELYLAALFSLPIWISAVIIRYLQGRQLRDRGEQETLV